MTDQEKIEALNEIRREWTGETEEGFYLPMTIDVLTTLFNQKYRDDMLNGDEIYELLGKMEDYAL